jgi:surfactin synthase thioesterase subunit
MDLPCAITAYCGTGDQHSRPEEMTGWREHTSGAFNLCLIRGNHFFLHSQQYDLLKNIALSLSKSAGLEYED